MPKASAAVQVDASIANHPAVRAWRKLGPERDVPDHIELLRKEKPASGVYRLAGIGPEGASVIAKKCESDAAGIECLVYQKILPLLPIGALRCYASIADNDARFSWLFLEDAGDGEYSPDLVEHRTLAGLWLGAMNLAAERLAVAARLPERGPTSYLEMLRRARRMTREKIEHPAFSAGDREVLKAIASHCGFLEKHWNRIDQFCAKMPRTLVHGDLSSWNARIRDSNTSKKLLIMDWESASWGGPATDLAQFAGNALTPDIAAYWSVVQACWPRLNLSDFRLSGNLGTVFRWVNAVIWANQSFHEGVDWYRTEMSFYGPEMAEWARGKKAVLEL